MRVYVYTLGCRLNQCESEAMADAFSSSGFEVVTSYESANLVIVNSCTVTSKAEQKARRMIRLFAAVADSVIVTGCYAELNRAEVEALSPSVTVFSLSEKASILSLPSHIIGETGKGKGIHEAVRSFCKRDTDPFAFDPSSFAYHSRAYLKVQDGCDNECGYCRTTVARGPSRWLDADEAVKRVLKLEREGWKEVMLTGVNLTNYDHDGEGLGGLLEKLLAATGPDIRFRLSSMEPDHVDERLLSAVSDSRVMPHFHIPIQSASPRVLDTANRHYSMDHVEYIIRKLREVKDDPFIACDVIAGLPGEREEDFLLTYDFLKRNDFSAMHVFPYSPREGTPLYGSPLKIEERVRDERAKRLRELSECQERSYTERQLGREVEVLVEKKGEGTTGNYLKVKIESPSALREGDLVRGRVVSLFPLTVSVF